ncbi:MAG: hypothetical protein ACI4NM_00915 [Bullifex sp.]
MEKKTLYERYGNETLTDNSALKKCEECKDCVYRDDGTIYSNRYDKGNCQKYPYPKMKPLDVIFKNAKCEYKKASQA